MPAQLMTAVETDTAADEAVDADAADEAAQTDAVTDEAVDADAADEAADSSATPVMEAAPAPASADDAAQPVAQQGPTAKSNGDPLEPWPALPPQPHNPLASDPIAPVLVGLLHGWGELAAEDVKRLSVFRPEKLKVAIQALELPKDLKDDPDARARLGQLTYYASQLETDAPKVQALESRAAYVQPPPFGASMPTAAATAGASAAALAAATALTRGDPKPTAGAAVPAGGETSALTPSTQTESSAAAPSSWSIRPVQDAAATGPLPAYAGSVAGARTDQHDPLDDTLETKPRPKAAPGGIVKTAEDVMALPPKERAEMVAFLEPAELSGVLKRTDDPELKRAVIDTLENVSTPASLDVLRECLEDRDLEIQMYALQAADRILGR